MPTEDPTLATSDPVSRRGFLTATSAGASFLAADVSKAAEQAGSPFVFEQALQIRQDLFANQARFAGQIFEAVMNDLGVLAARNQKDTFRMARAGLAQLQQDGFLLEREVARLSRNAQILIAATHVARPSTDQRVSDTVKALAKEMVEAPDATPLAITLGNLTIQTAERNSSPDSGVCGLLSGLGGAVVGDFIWGAAWGPIFIGAVTGWIIGVGVCTALGKKGGAT